MQVIYEGTDITESIKILKADIYDRSSGKADSLEILISDTEEKLAQWNLQKNQKIELIENDFSSGVMFSDYLQQMRGMFCIKALSIPQEAKTSSTKCWEHIRLLEIAQEIASKYGFSLKTYNVTDYLYTRVNQNDKSDFEFLNYLCALEGYALKITDSQVVIYDERYMESLDPVITLYKKDVIKDYNFKSISQGLYNSCVVKCSNSVKGIIEKEFKPLTAPSGPKLKKEIYMSSMDEAERFSKNILRYYNKYENTGRVNIKYNPNLTAGVNINIDGFGAMADGTYFIDQAVHRYKEEISILQLRKPLAEY